MGVSKSVVDGGGALGTLVWVQKRNGEWWPGRVVGPSEVSTFAVAAHQLSSSSSSSSSTCKTPIMLLGQDYQSVDWYNLEKSKRIKPFRNGEFVDCIEQAESSQASTFAENMKYTCRQGAILHALELEKKEQQNKCKRAGEVQAETVCRAKRSRCSYLPIQSQSSKVSASRVESDDSTFISGVAAQRTASLETESYSSKSDHRDYSDRRRVEQASGHLQRQMRSMKLKNRINSSKSPNYPIDAAGIEQDMCEGEVNISSLRGRPSTDGKRSFMKNSIGKITDPLATAASSQEIECTPKAESGVKLNREVSQSAPAGSKLHESDIDYFGSAYTVQQNGMETMLIDVNLTIQQNRRDEHVPIICLVSRMSKKAIIGHPIDIELLQDSSGSSLPRKGSVSKRLFEDDRSRIHQLVWKTSRRTPVCYISNYQSCPTREGGKNASASQHFRGTKAKRNDLSLAVESSGTSMKYTFPKDKDLAHSIKHKGSGNDGRKVTSVPVKHIFSKLIVAVGKL